MDPAPSPPLSEREIPGSAPVRGQNSRVKFGSGVPEAPSSPTVWQQTSSRLPHGSSQETQSWFGDDSHKWNRTQDCPGRVFESIVRFPASLVVAVLRLTRCLPIQFHRTTQARGIPSGPVRHSPSATESLSRSRISPSEVKALAGLATSSSSFPSCSPGNALK